MRLGYGRLHLPVDTTFDGTSTGCNRMVGDDTLHAGDSRIPGMIDLAVKLNLDNLTALVVNMGTDNKALLSALGTMTDGNDVTGDDFFIFVGHSCGVKVGMCMS